MLDYFQTYYIARSFGPGYVATSIAYVIGLVLVLNDVQLTPRGIVRKAGECALFWLLSVLYCSVYYMIFGHSWMDRSMMAVILAVYALFISRYKPVTRIVRSFVYFSSTLLMIPVSEPIGELIKDNINAEYTWAEHLTSVVMILATALVVLFLRRYSTEKLTFIPRYTVWLVVVTSMLSGLLMLLSEAVEVSRAFNVPTMACLWIIELMSYYMFYIVNQEYERNLELVAIGHKEALEEELLQFSRDNYEEMHQIRHEIKNHLAYLQVLAEQGEYEKLKSYLHTVSGETEELFQFVECGNDVINAVMNHAICQARNRGVEIDAQIIVPPTLPYEETQLCSLLSNLMDNAIEAAAQSGAESPTVRVLIRPQQDYLFLRVTNPVRTDLPPRRVLSLHTTKEDQKLHGYGTKIIRNVAERYQGSVKFDLRDGIFLADVMLYLEEGREDG
ncbi:MAG: GHKL domain-containing protein [Clostridiales bacterium]|nr:GHKL domain-containing protein [Clostridiales bacterium]